jgi:hypothetical protein
MTAQGEWMPIDTAPKGHGLPHLLLWGKHWLRPGIGYYLERTDDWRGVTTKAFYYQPTHWMPLPAPPESAS